MTRAGHKSDTAEAKAAKYRPPHSHRLTVISVVLCSVKKGLTQKLGVLCFVLINSVLDEFFKFYFRTLAAIHVPDFSPPLVMNFFLLSYRFVKCSSLVTAAI